MIHHSFPDDSSFFSRLLIILFPITYHSLALQGGFLVGDVIYAIPENADTLLKLYTRTQTIELIPLRDVLK